MDEFMTCRVHFPEAAMGIPMHEKARDHSEYTEAVKR
jgi:hypothetical protein